MVPSYKPHIELGPMAPNGISPHDLWRAGEAEWQHCAGGQRDPPLGRGEGESFRDTLEYLLECIPQVLICVLAERVQIHPHGARKENRVLGMGWI